jgi:hypothetical protein
MSLPGIYVFVCLLQHYPSILTGNVECALEDKVCDNEQNHAGAEGVCYQLPPSYSKDYSSRSFHCRHSGYEYEVLRCGPVRRYPEAYGHEEPQYAEIVVDTDTTSVDEAVKEIVKYIKKNYVK